MRSLDPAFPADQRRVLCGLAILSEVTLIEWPVSTERLSLRAYTPDDIDALWTFEQLPQVQQWLGWAPISRDELREAMDAKSSNTTHVMVRLNSTIIGHIMIMPRDSWAQMDVLDRAKGLEAELGWMFNPAHGGKGYATEAVGAAIGLCFDALNVRRIHAGCFADNTASWRLMEHLGLRRETHGRATSLHREGTWHDGLTYALLREEWPLPLAPGRTPPNHLRREQTDQV
ncbi:MAG: GNAT family N-acetyltransferase [Mycobacterium sp.]|nr:GNAT family N-acetyltransferase [Mycobacterium sp.]